MAVGIVDRLEVVGIDHQQGEFVAVPRRTQHLVFDQFPEHALVVKIGQRIARCVVLQILGVFVDCLDRADDIEQRGENALHHQQPHRVCLVLRLHADADDAADHRRIDQQRLDLHIDIRRAKFRHAPGGVGDVVPDPNRAAALEMFGALQYLLQAGFANPLGDVGGAVAPEDFEVVGFFGNLEHREHQVGRHHAVDIEDQAADVIAPVLDDLRGEHEFFEQADFEFQHVLVDGDGPDALGKLPDFACHRVEFGETKVDLPGFQRAQVGDPVDGPDVGGQLVDRRFEAASNVEHHQEGHDQHDRHNRGKGIGKAGPVRSNGRRNVLLHVDDAEDVADCGIHVALEADFLRVERIDDADHVARVQAQALAVCQGVADCIVRRFLGNVAEQGADLRPAIYVDLARAVIDGFLNRAEEAVELPTIPAGAHQLEHGVEGEFGEFGGVFDGIVAHRALVDGRNHEQRGGEDRDGKDAAGAEQKPLDAAQGVHRVAGMAIRKGIVGLCSGRHQPAVGLRLRACCASRPRNAMAISKAARVKVSTSANSASLRLRASSSPR